MRCLLLAGKCNKIVYGRGFAPTPLEEVTALPQTPKSWCGEGWLPKNLTPAWGFGPNTEPIERSALLNNRAVAYN